MSKKRKQRKRTSADVPAKGRLRDMADRLWSKAVAADWNHCCAVCGARSGIMNAHHLIPRQHYKSRYDLQNGICLCVHDHQFNPNWSPHQNAAGWLGWLRDHHQKLHAWYVRQMDSGEYQKFDEKLNAAYFISQIQRLREYVEPEEFERVVGVRFGAWLEQ